MNDNFEYNYPNEESIITEKNDKDINNNVSRNNPILNIGNDDSNSKEEEEDFKETEEKKNLSAYQERIRQITKHLINEYINKKSFSLEKVLIKIQKKIDIQVDDNRLFKESIKEIAKFIENIYPKGVESIFEGEKEITSNTKVFMAFRMNCSNNFRRKYSYFGRIYSECLNYDEMIKKKKHVMNKFSDSIKDLIKQNEKDIGNNQDDKENDLIRRKLIKTSIYKNLIYATFEEFDTQEKILLEEVIDRYCMKKANEIRESNPSKYPSSDIIKKHLNGKSYYELAYEDYILIICRMIRFMSGLNISCLFANDLNFYIKFYSPEETTEKLAEKYKYEMCLKNYAAYYFGVENQYREKKGMSAIDIGKDNREDSALLIKNYLNPPLNGNIIQPYELDEENVINYPPYFEFEREKKRKFMRYSFNDKQHACPFDTELTTEKIYIDDSSFETSKILNTVIGEESVKEKDFRGETKFLKDVEPNCCSKFRNIDTLRLIYQEIDSYVSFINMIKGGVLESTTFCNNYKEYKEDLSVYSIIFGSSNYFNIKSQYKYIETLRNFFGEKVSFYFLFIYKLIIWMIFPALIGIACFFFLFIIKNKNTNEDVNVVFTHLTVKEIVSLSFCGIITVWATLFLDSWNQIQKKFSYFWGTTHSSETETKRENFVPDKEVRFLFNQNIEKVDKYRKLLKSIISILVIVFLIAISISLIILLFYIKAIKAKSDPNSVNWPIIIGMLNSIQIKIMSMIYRYITRKITDWQNYSTQTKYENALALKYIFFEFINNYSSLFYIAFIKRSIEGKCLNNDSCVDEMNIQIYMILATNLGINFLELGIPYISNLFKIRKFKKECKLITGGKDIHIENHSLEYQNICDEYDTTMNDFIEIVIYFGYVSLFAVISPLTPLLVIILLYFERHVDTFKIVNLFRVTSIKKSDGIEVFSLIFKIIYFIGMTNSIAIIIFTELNKLDYPLASKIAIFAAVENLVLILMVGLKWNILPYWFSHRDLISQLYNKMFYSKVSSRLPHHFLSKKIILSGKENKNQGDGIERLKDLAVFESDLEDDIKAK